MSWNYRVLRKDSPEGAQFVVHEVYYDDVGAIKFWSENPILPFGETEQELRNDLQRMLNAVDRPLLQERDGRLVDV